MTTVNQLPIIVAPKGSDVILIQEVSTNGEGGVTGKASIDAIAALVPAVQVNASNVAAAGAVMDDDFTINGYMKRTGAGTYSTVTVIPVADVTGLTLDALSDVSISSPSNGQILSYTGSEWKNVANPTVSVDASSVSAAGAVMRNMFAGSSGYMRKLTSTTFDVTTAIPATAITNLGALATTSTAASGRTFLGFTTLGTNLVVNSTTDASARSFLGLSTLATTSTAASAKSFIGLPTTTTDDAITRFNGTSGDMQNSVVIVEDAGSMYGYQGKLNVIAGSSYTVVSSDTGKILMTTAAVTCSITLPNSMQPGFNATFLQKGSGVIQFTAGTSSTLEQRQSYTKSAGQYAAVGLVVSENSNGTAAHYLLSGDMA